MEEIKDSLNEFFLLYHGPINSSAIHRVDDYGNRYAHDQHSIAIDRNDKPDIDVWEEGTLKIYCPSILLAFSAGDELKRLNKILFNAEPFLYSDTPILRAVQSTSTSEEYEFFVNALKRYIDNNQGTQDLAKRALSINFLAYDRSIGLQKIFLEENLKNDLDNRDIQTQAIYAVGRQEAIFIAMAPHYAVEAVFDDQFTDFPYHLPDYINRTILDNSPVHFISNFDCQKYERGLANSIFGAPVPDMYRFDPILASLIAPLVMKSDGTFEHYEGWEDFQNRVIDKVKDATFLQATDLFAKGMQIPKEFVFFAAYKMCQKEVRKRGIKRLYQVEMAKVRAEQIAQDYSDALAYFSSKDFYFRSDYYEESEGVLKDTKGIVLSKDRFLCYKKAIVDRAAVAYVNSIIGTYKFIPWVKDDANFIGAYLPYAVMKSEKDRILKVLCAEEFSDYWQEKGFWFKKILPGLMESHPSMYSKWFIPLLEKDMIDKAIIDDAGVLAREYLSSLAFKEDSHLRYGR